MKVTVANWLTPDGVSISEEGITPDIEIEITGEDEKNNKDPQMDLAVSFISSI